MANKKLSGCAARLHRPAVVSTKVCSMDATRRDARCYARRDQTCHFYSTAMSSRSCVLIDIDVDIENREYYYSGGENRIDTDIIVQYKNYH